MPALLEIHNAARYFGGLAAVKNVTVDVQEGEILGLIGPNGAGKTTLLNLIGGVMPLSEGEIRFQGRALKGLRPNAIARLGISRTFQIVKPFPGMSVRENVAIGAMFGAGGHQSTSTGAALAKADEILDFLSLGHKREAKISDTTIADRKRIELARALAMSPKLLLLDEVMAGLNQKEVGDIMELVRHVNRQGVTILVIEHVMRAIMGISDRILVLHHGQPIALGTPQEVATDQNVIAAYLGDRFVERNKAA